MFTLETEHPVAYTSPDHLYPQGTKNDKGGPSYTWENGFNPFVDEVVTYFNRPDLKVLDLGAASGYLVKDFMKRGCITVGLEGSDWSIKNKVKNWKELYGKNLFTCDIGKPFQIKYNQNPVKFNLINAWEVVEHLPPEELSVFTENVYNHLEDDGIFVCSISPWFEPSVINPSVNLHLAHKVTSKQDWKDIFNRFEFIGPLKEAYDSGYHYIFQERYRGRVREQEGAKHTFWSTMRKKL
jgi:hypothetical protein